MSTKRKNVTIREIAQRAGVSISTVSRVMGGKDTAIPISEATRQRVMEVCDELKFLPDVNYTRLQERRSFVIGLMIPRARPDSPLPFFADEPFGLFLSTLEPELASHGYSILIQGVDPAYESSRRHLTILRNNSVDGLIIWDAFHDPGTILQLNDEHRPSICIAFPYEGATHSIVPDNYQGAYDMTRHLLDLGHRRIAYINGGMNETVDNLRESGYRAAMAESGLPTVILKGGYTFRGGFACGEQILKDYPETTAIFAANDLMAIGAMKCAKLSGRRIPEDLAVAGFDGSSHSTVATPNVTTGRLPMEEIGKIAAQGIMDLVERRRPDPLRAVLPIEILKRESTVPA